MKRAAFVGSKALGLAVAKEMARLAPEQLAGIITIDDTNDTRSALDAFEQFAQESQIPLHVLSKSGELKSVIQELEPNLCVVVGWYWLLKAELLAMVPDGWLGIHASLLPQYRGGAPLVWAVINGEKQTGLSLFYFDEGMDTGDVVAQRQFSVEFTDTIADVLKKAEHWSLDVIRENYPLLLRGTAPRHTQDHSGASYVALRGPEDGRIEWNQPAEDLYNFIRAQTHPYPGAFCLTASQQTLRVWEAAPFPHPYYGTPGKVVMISGDEAVVTCASPTALRLLRVQLAGQEERGGAEVLKFGERLT